MGITFLYDILLFYLKYETGENIYLVRSKQILTLIDDLPDHNQPQPQQERLQHYHDFIYLPPLSNLAGQNDGPN